MQAADCAAFQLWLRGAGEDLSVAEPALIAHAAACPNCRGLLVSTAAALLPPPPAADVGCAACRAGLAAFIDLEADAGTMLAAQNYPHVWWHLLVCPRCASAYATVCRMRAAFETGLIPPLPRLKLVPHFEAATFRRSYLHRLFEPQGTLGTSWGEPDRQELRDLHSGDHTASVHIAQTPAAAWEFGFTIVPPISGTGVLIFGDITLRTPIDRDGHAIFAPLPQAELGAPDGPDLVIQIEAADSTA